MLLETQSTAFVASNSPDSTDAAWASVVPQLAEPVGTGVIDLRSSFGSFVQNAAIVVPYATGATLGTFSERIYGWHQFGADPKTRIWVPVLLAEIACTLCATTGVANGIIPTTQLFCDTISLAFGGNVETDSPANGVSIAHIILAIKGFQKLQCNFKINTGPTAMNSLLALL